MNFWKWISSAGALLFIAIIITTYVSRERPSHSVTKKSPVPTKAQTKTLEKKQNLGQAKKTSDVKRKPGSLAPPSPKAKSDTSSKKDKRKIIGDQDEGKNKSQIELENRYSSDWKKKLNKNLKNSLTPRQRAHIEVKIRPKKSIIKKTNNDKGKLYEVVVISLIPQNGEKQNTYEALVNSQTGKIERTWNRTIHEPSSREELKSSLRPTGTL